MKEIKNYFYESFARNELEKRDKPFLYQLRHYFQGEWLARMIEPVIFYFTGSMMHVGIITKNVTYEQVSAALFGHGRLAGQERRENPAC